VVAAIIVSAAVALFMRFAYLVESSFTDPLFGRLVFDGAADCRRSEIFDHPDASASMAQVNRSGPSRCWASALNLLPSSLARKASMGREV